jgi:hypothetical protein
MVEVPAVVRPDSPRQKQWRALREQLGLKP